MEEKEVIEVNGKTVEVTTNEDGIEVNQGDFDFTEEEKTEVEKRIMQLPRVQKKNMELNQLKRAMAEQGKTSDSGNQQETRQYSGNSTESGDVNTLLMKRLGITTTEDLRFYKAENPADYAEALVEVKESVFADRIRQETSRQATETALLNKLAFDGYDSTEARDYIVNLLGAKVTQSTIDAYRATHQRTSKSIGDIQSEKQSQKMTWINPGKSQEKKDPTTELLERTRQKINSDMSGGRYKF